MDKTSIAVKGAEFCEIGANDLCMYNNKFSFSYNGNLFHQFTLKYTDLIVKKCPMFNYTSVGGQ